ncbi:MAG: TonB-dependent receptor [Flavobacteriaceae bacterium]|nr:TonB-dependent receptor [Flavobacteriaceae bacterium]
MKRTKKLNLLWLLLFAALFTQAVQAQRGNIQGTITDESGLVVPFGSVMIDALKKGVVSDVNGKFLFVDVPAGTHTVKVQYLGYATKEVEANVVAGQTTVVRIQILPQAESLEEVTVLGSNGQAKALNAQKNKWNITNVVSTDQIGKFPDANIGDAVKRIAGVTMQVDQGEARNIIVRGLAPELNSVTLNGSRIPSAEGDNRNIQMDLIPSDMIQTIEVNKAVTPDMDGDALGGSVNLVTRTSPEQFRFSATLGSGINFIHDKRILNGSFLVGDRTENKKFGWMIGASLHDSDFGSDNIEFEWDDSEDAFIKEHDIRTYLVQRIRRSVSANFDYAFTPDHVLSFKSMYNWRDDRENRYRLRYKDIEEDGGQIIAEVRRQTKGGIDNNRNKNTRLEDQRMQNYSLGGEHLFGKVKVDWMAAYSKASEERLNERYIEYRVKDVAVNTNLSDLRKPVISAVNAADVDVDQFELKDISEENKYTDEKDFNAFLNFEIPADFFGQGNGTVKFGGRLKLKDKERENDYFEYGDETDAYEIMGSQPLVNKTNADFLAGSQYAAGQFVDPSFLGNLDLYNASLFEKEDIPDEYLGENYTAKEDVFAAYAMTNQNIAENFSVMAGVRLESTKTEATGNVVNYDSEGDYDGHAAITKENTYSNILPSVHFKYNMNPNTILRFAWTNTMARPNYKDLVPYQNIINEDGEIESGNSDLEATTSMNFDFMAEHYFKSVGIISGGLFYKDIKNFIYTSTFEATGTTYGAGTDGYDVFQPQNGDDASIFGAEINFQRQLDFLPGFARNFNLMLNYTYLTTDATGIKNEDGDLRDDVDLPGTAPHMFNGSLAYVGKKLNMRLSANFSDAYVDEVGGNKWEDRYYGQQFLMDFNASFAINKNWSIYMDVNNLTDQELRYYQGVKDRTMQAEWYGRRLTFGVKYNFFGK